MLGLLVAGSAAWLVPIVLIYAPAPFENIRFFFPAMVLFSIVAGAAVARIWVMRFGRVLAGGLLLAMVATSVTFQIHYSLMTIGTIKVLGDDTPVSSPRPPIVSPAPARIPYAQTRNDLEDRAYVWDEVPDDTVMLSIAPSGVHPNMALSGLQMQVPYFGSQLQRFNEVAMNLRYDELRDLGIDMLYVETVAARASSLPIERLGRDPRFEEIYTNGFGSDTRFIYRLQDATDA